MKTIYERYFKIEENKKKTKRAFHEGTLIKFNTEQMAAIKYLLRPWFRI